MTPFRPRRNLLLGGAGLLGRALDKALHAAGEQTVVFDLKDGFDLRSSVPTDVREDDYCWFLAWDVGGAKYIFDPDAQLQILHSNLSLMTNVFRWIERHHLMFSFVSTQLAGFPNAYGITKLAAEYWASQLSNGFVARLWNCYGAEEVGVRSHVIPDLIAQAQAASLISLKTSGEERRQFLHADDVAQALMVQRSSGQAFADVTSGVWVPIRKIAEIVARQMNATVKLGQEKGSESLVEPTRPLVGWSPTIDLEQGIGLVIRQTLATAPVAATPPETAYLSR